MNGFVSHLYVVSMCRTYASVSVYFQLRIVGATRSTLAHDESPYRALAAENALKMLPVPAL